MTIIAMMLGMLALGGGMRGTAEGFHRDYMAPSRMRYWKGLCVLLILLSHYTGYICTDTADESYLMLRQWLGQSPVMLFFFCSGYGMMKQAIRRGRGYLTSLPGRFSRIWLTCAVSVALMLVVQMARGRTYMPVTIAMAFACWANVGNSTWYIFVILVSYVLFALSILPMCLKPGMMNRMLAAVLLTGLTAAFVAWMQHMELEEYWYDTVMLLPLGAWWALTDRHGERLIQRSGLTWVLTVLVMSAAAMTLFVHRDDSFWMHEGWLTTFCALIVLLSMKVTPVSRLLGFCGDHVLPIYLFQRIPMIILYESGLLDSVPHLGLFVTLAACAVMAMVYDGVTQAIGRRLERKQIHQ